MLQIFENEFIDQMGVSLTSIRQRLASYFPIIAATRHLFPFFPWPPRKCARKSAETRTTGT
jgi:hypothetical protein